MDVEILQENLLKGLSLINHFVSTKTSLPILNNILIKTTETGISLQASNTEQSIEYQVPAKINTNGKGVFPAKLLLEYIQALKPGKITLIVDQLQLLIKTKENSAELNGINPEEFPTLPSFEDDLTVELSASLISQVNNLISFSTTKDNNRPVLTGILFSFSTDGTLSIVSTDGFRLSLLKVSLKIELKEPLHLIIPTLIFSELEKMVKESSTTSIQFKFSLKNQSLILSLPTLTLTSRLIAGEFPPYQKILPTKTNLNLSVLRQDLLDCLKAAILFARHNNYLIKILVKESSLEITAQAGTMGKQKTTLDIKSEGFSNEILLGFNAKYFLDVLQHVDSEFIQIGINEALTPVTFKSNNQDFLHVIMPVRI